MLELGVPHMPLKLVKFHDIIQALVVHKQNEFRR